MECYVPGKLLIAPNTESKGPDYLIEQLREEFSGDFDLDFKLDDILKANDIDPFEARASRGLPFVGRVPEGAEEDLAERISRLPGVGGATPDYLVYPNASVQVNANAIADALQQIGGDPPSPVCGTGCRVAVLDSGIDSQILGSANVHPRQFDALDPYAPVTSPSDPTGHGTTVAAIIAAVAPGAELVSIRVLSSNGTISGVIAGLYLARAAGPCDIVNLSLSVQCAPVPCRVCRTPTAAAINLAQLSYFFGSYIQTGNDVALIAAAGRHRSHVALPAAIDQIIAVGAFDYRNRTPDSTFHQVPQNRYVMAPAGESSSSGAFGNRPGSGSSAHLHGTSFATAFVSGLAARIVCNLKASGCGSPLQATPSAGFGTSPLAQIVGELAHRSDRNWTDFDINKHGLGALRFYFE